MLAVAAIMLALAVYACGGSAQESQASGACLTEIRGKKSRILPQNSKLSCDQITSILYTLSSVPGVYPVKSTGPERERTCKVYPKSALPVEIKCWRGKRHFTVVAVA